jgi:DNA-binding transcriptional LysR family regulator
MLNLHHVQAFVAVAAQGGFGAAARQLEVSQATVSQQVRKLEEAVGRRLIERRRERCTPTAAGRDFLPYAHSLLKTAGAALSKVAPTCATIGASSNIGTYLLHPLLGKAETPVEVTIGSNPLIAEELIHGRVDLALMEWWDDRPGFAARCFRKEPMVLIVPPAHPWRRFRRISRDRLVEIELLGGEPGTGTGRLLAEYLGDLAPKLRVRMRLGSTEAVKQWVKAGLGSSLVLAATVARERADGTLHVIDIKDDPPRKHLWAIWPEWLLPRHPAALLAERILRG